MKGLVCEVSGGIKWHGAYTDVVYMNRVYVRERECGDKKGW